MSDSGKPPPSCSTVTLSDELSTIPLVHSMVELYDSAKTSPWVGVGVRLAEWSCLTVAGQINLVCGNKVSAVNECAGGYVASIKDRFPILRKPTSEVVDGVSESVKTGAKFALHSLPGQTFLVGLDGMVAASSYVLELAETPCAKKSSTVSRKPARFKDAPKNGKSTTTKPSESTKGTQTPNRKTGEKSTESILKKPTQQSDMRYKLTDLYCLVVVSTLQSTVTSMVKLRSILYKLDGRKHRLDKSTGLTPEKKIEIEARRKVSPTKRLGTTMFGKIKRTARHLFGMGSKAITLYQTDIRSYLNLNSGNDTDHAEKRKYDEIQTDPDSDDSLADFDIDEYNSEEDSDYMDPSDHSTDSMEYEAGDTESDISFEHKPGGPIQIRDKSGVSSHSDQGHAKVKSSASTKITNGSGTKTTIGSASKVTNGTEAKDKTPAPAQNGVNDSKGNLKTSSGGPSAISKVSSPKKSDPAKSSSAPSKAVTGEKSGKDTSQKAGT